MDHQGSPHLPQWFSNRHLWDELDPRVLYKTSYSETFTGHKKIIQR